jgi:glycosyltransferase involved in cell wall biosynthesis
MQNLKSKRILIFSLFYYPKNIGGAEIAIKEITDRIDSSDIQFDLITLCKGDRKFENIGNINIYRIGSYKLLYPFLAFWKALKLNKINKYDSIWSMMASYAGLAGYLFKKFNSKTNFILTLQEGEFNKIRFIKPLVKKIIVSADIIQVISNFLADWAREMGYKSEIVVIPNAVDLNLFSNNNSIKRESDDVNLITTSRLVKKNAIEDIIESLVYLPNNIKLLIIGTGELQNKLKQKAKDLQLTNRVNFVGYVSHSEMSKYLHASDIFIRPSLSEGFGNSFIEAMASRVPVIATPVGGIIDFLKDGETGLFCEVKNPKSIAQKVEKLIKDKESREYIVRNAYEMVKNKYDWNIIANDMKNKVFLKMI